MSAPILVQFRGGTWQGDIGWAKCSNNDVVICYIYDVTVPNNSLKNIGWVRALLAHPTTTGNQLIMYKMRPMVFHCLNDPSCHQERGVLIRYMPDKAMLFAPINYHVLILHEESP